MGESRKKHKISLVIIILLCGLSQSRFPGETLTAAAAPQTAQVEENAAPQTVYAAEPSLPPHLIQSVSAQDLYEGMVALGLSNCPLTTEEDREEACENVKNCVVRIDMEKAHGSGVVYCLTQDGVIIATNRHVLEYWQENTGVVWFPQGFYVSAQLLGTSQNCDVGFLKVDGGALGVETLLTLRNVFVEEEIYKTLTGGEDVFCLGADWETGTHIYQEAVVEKTEEYIDLFGGNMLYLRGFAKEGMSGGGIFDGHGRLLGLLAGGTWQNEIAGVPVDQVAQAYREIVGE